MIVCVHMPRFELAVAAGGRRELADGPLALAPDPGRDPRIGQVSGKAEALGVRAGMRIGEAMSRAPDLKLLPADPEGVDDAFDLLVRTLESIGAAVERGEPGIAFFQAEGLRRLHGGTLRDVIVAADDALRNRRDSICPGVSPRYGAAPVRFAAMAAALASRPRRPRVGPSDRRELAAWLADEPISLLALRPETAHLVEQFEHFGILTLGDLAAIPRSSIADRFGHAGLVAHDLARGIDTVLRPETPGERLEEEMELPEAASGEQLGRTLELLVDRLLARRERQGRAIRVLVITAKLAAGGTWRERATFREAMADPRRIRMVLDNKIGGLPSPATALRLRVEAFGPAAGDQLALLADEVTVRTGRLREAVAQARASVGIDSALRVVGIDPDSRVPERRFALAPWEPGDER